MIFLMRGMLLFCEIMKEQMASQASCFSILMPDAVSIASLSVGLSDRERMLSSISA